MAQQKTRCWSWQVKRSKQTYLQIWDANIYSLVLKKFTVKKRHEQIVEELGLHDLDQHDQSKLEIKSLMFAEQSEAAHLRQLMVYLHSCSWNVATANLFDWFISE